MARFVRRSPHPVALFCALSAWGHVHPPTGCVRLSADGALIVDLPLATDPERAWNYVQDSMLPALEAHIRQVCEGTPRRERQPFFSELTFDAWLSEGTSPWACARSAVAPGESARRPVIYRAGFLLCPPWQRTAATLCTTLDRRGRTRAAITAGTALDRSRAGRAPYPPPGRRGGRSTGAAHRCRPAAGAPLALR